MSRRPLSLRTVPMPKAILTTTVMTTGTDIMSITTESLLGLLHLASPALPVGAFAYSQGLETAIDRQWCYNRETTGNWISELMQQGMARLDIPVFFRLYDAFSIEDQKQVTHWNNTLLAFRETVSCTTKTVRLAAHSLSG